MILSEKLRRELKSDVDETKIRTKDRLKWECSKCGHIWSTHVENRTRLETGCPKCSKRSMWVKRYGSLVAKKGSVADLGSNALDFWVDERDPSLIPPSSHSIVKLKCPNGHKFEKSVREFVKRPECSKCLLEHESLLARFPRIIEIWSDENDLGPESYKPGSGKSVFWKCRNGHSSFSSIKNKLRGIEDSEEHVLIRCQECSYSTPSLEGLVIDYLRVCGVTNIIRNSKPLHNNGRKFEIDILISDRALGFEVQDFWTHSREQDNETFMMFGSLATKKGPQYHEQKRTLAAEQLGINLVDLWQDNILDGSYKNEINRLLDEV